MFSYIRLLELAGRKMVREALTPREAKHLLHMHGATDADLASLDSLKAARIRLIRANDPNLPGASQLAAQEINSAYDTLKKDGLNSSSDSKGPTSRPTARPHDASSRQDYSDLNYFKQHIAELAGAEGRSYTIHNWDGAFFRGVVTVRGCPRIFTEMAKAMRQWDSHFKCEAIMVHESQSRDLQLIYLAPDHFLDGSIQFEHDSFNLNPGNDQHFCRKLPDVLKKILTGL